MAHLSDSKHSSNLSEFTDDEIREQLECLGFKNVSKDKFNQFKTDLEKLITHEVSINTSNSDFYQPTAIKKPANTKAESLISHSELLSKQSNESDRLSKNKRVTFPDNLSEESDDSDQSFTSIVTTSSIVDNKVLKRKVIRKTSSKAVTDLLMNPNNQRVEKNPIDLEENEQVENTLSENESCEDTFEDQEDEQLMKLNDCYPPIQYPVKSFIRSQSSLSGRSDASRTSLKCNPVQRFQEYSKLWKKQKMPGEKSHNDLRWSIREQMLAKDVIVKKQPKAHVPNMYAVPTDKKRQQLRWAVRNALANQL